MFIIKLTKLKNKKNLREIISDNAKIYKKRTLLVIDTSIEDTYDGFVLLALPNRQVEKDYFEIGN
jgi:hypothetical protein